MFLHCVQLVGDSIRGNAGQPVRSAPVWLEDRPGWNKHPHDPYRLQPCVHIQPVPVPGQQSVDRKGVPKVVNSGDGRSIVGNVALSQQPVKGLIDRAVVQAPGAQVQEERRVRRMGLDTNAPVQIRLHRPAGGSTQRHPAGLAESRVSCMRESMTPYSALTDAASPMAPRKGRST